MDAVEFIKARNRMCYNHNGCFKCPLEDKECDYICDIDTDAIVPIVEQWAKEHPAKTRQSEFLKQWPNAKIRTNGVVDILPCLMDIKFRTEDGGCGRPDLFCEDCCREFWLQEVE